MKGSIRFFIGLLLVSGSVGGVETESASLLEGILLSAVGLAIMYSGANAMKENV